MLILHFSLFIFHLKKGALLSERHLTFILINFGWWGLFVFALYKPGIVIEDKADIAADKIII